MLEKFSWCNFRANSDLFLLKNFRKNSIERSLFYEDLEFYFAIREKSDGLDPRRILLDLVSRLIHVVESGFSMVKIDCAIVWKRLDDWKEFDDSIGESWLWTDIGNLCKDLDCVNVKDQKNIRDFFVLICHESASDFHFKMKLHFYFDRDVRMNFFFSRENFINERNI